MKKKGFTLIELLAVIVILAIIALIATPIVLNIISESKESATLQSAEFYLGAVETAVAQKIIDDPTFRPETCGIQKDGNLLCGTTEVKVEINGEKPTSGTINLKNGQITEVQLVLNEKTIVKEPNGDLEYQTEPNSIVIFDGDITFNGDDGLYYINQCFDKTNFKNNSKYKITINNVNGVDQIYEVTSSLGKIYYYNSDSDEEFMLDGLVLGNQQIGGYAHIYEPNVCYFYLWDEELSLGGNHHIKIEYIEKEEYSHVLRITDESIQIFSNELVEGDAIVEIKDSDGIVTELDVVFESESANSTMWISISDYQNDSTISPLFNKWYQDLQQEKNITVTVKQGNNSYVLGGTNFEFSLGNQCNSDNYYWGNNKLGFLFGC